MDIIFTPKDIGLSLEKDPISVLTPNPTPEQIEKTLLTPFRIHTKNWEPHYLAQVLRSAGAEVAYVSWNDTDITLSFAHTFIDDALTTVRNLAVTVLSQPNSGVPLAQAVAVYTLQLNPNLLNKQLRQQFGPEVIVYVDGELITLVSKRVLDVQELATLAKVFTTWRLKK